MNSPLNRGSLILPSLDNRYLGHLLKTCRYNQTVPSFLNFFFFFITKTTMSEPDSIIFHFSRQGRHSEIGPWFVVEFLLLLFNTTQIVVFFSRAEGVGVPQSWCENVRTALCNP